MKKIIYILAIIGAFTFSSCESEVSFLELAGQQGFVFNGTTQDIQTYIGQEAYDKFKVDLRMPINTGDNPPVLNGNFVLNEAAIYDEILDEYTFNQSYIEFYLANQNNEELTLNYMAYFWHYGIDGVFDTTDDEMTAEEESIPGEPVYISGDAAGNFTIILKTQVAPGRVDVVAVSGKRVVNGIEDLEYAYVKYDNGDPDTGNIEFGVRIIDGDFFSEPF
jgi:hypothetical protein